MNQTQRAFLIKKIDEQVKIRVSALQEAIPDCPSITNYLFHAVMSGKFEIKPNEDIKQAIISKALKAKEGDNWLGADRWNTSKVAIHFPLREIFIIPEEYEIEYKKYDQEKRRLESEISQIHLQAETLKTRIQLASDKTLQTMINEVDDMGNISLMDSKLKLLAI